MPLSVVKRKEEKERGEIFGGGDGSRTHVQNTDGAQHSMLSF